jgi:hypothetical protein
MKPMVGLLILFAAATLVIVFAGSYGDGVIQIAGYVATLALGGMAALLARRPR